MSLNKIAEVVKGNEDFSDLKSSTFRDVLNGNIRQKISLKTVRFISLIAVLTFLRGQPVLLRKTGIERSKLKKELQDVKFESLTISAELTKLSRRTYVLDYIEAKGLNLKESPYAPVVIEEPDPVKDEEVKNKKEAHKAATVKVKATPRTSKSKKND